MDVGLQNLLDLHGVCVNRDDGYWWKIEAWLVKPTRERPHGIRYNLTLHDKHNVRVFGIDNAHAVKQKRPKPSALKLCSYDHLHLSKVDAGTPYHFQDSANLMNDFFAGVDKTIAQLEGHNYED